MLTLYNRTVALLGPDLQNVLQFIVRLS